MSSLTFTGSRQQYLTRNLQPSNLQKYSVSFFLKRTAGGANDLALFTSADSSFGSMQLRIFYTDAPPSPIEIYLNQSGGVLYVYDTNQIIDVDNKWHHFLLAVDTTQIAAANRVHVYVDAIEINTYGTITGGYGTYPVQNQSAFSTGSAAIGAWASVLQFLSGKLDEFCFVEGVQLTPSDLVYVNIDGTVSPKIYSGAFGSAGFRLTFDDLTSIATLCYDKSGNHNDWIPQNIALSDATSDSPGLVLAPSTLTTGSPVFGAPDMMAGTVVGLSLAVGSPVLDAPAFHAIGINTLSALSGAVLGPDLGQPFMINFAPATLDSNWQKDSGVKIGWGQIAPDGSDHAVVVADSKVTGQFRIWQTATKPGIAHTYRLSFDVAPTGAAGINKNVELRMTDGASAFAYAIFDPDTGEVLKRDCTADFRMLAVEADPLQFNFHRLVLMAEANSSTTIRGMLSLMNGLNNTYLGDGTGAVIIWNPLLLDDIDKRDFRWQIGPPEMRFYWTVHIADVGLRWFRCSQGELGVDHHLEFNTAPDLDCVLHRWQPAQDELVFDFSGALLAGGGDPMAGTP